ncbi:hypothetical protein D9M71_436560 [compost metagenome]
MHEGDAQAQVAQTHRCQGAQGRALAQGDGLEHQHQGRVSEQNQPLKPGADVLQPVEIEQARQVITEQSQQHHPYTIGKGHGRIGRAAAGPHQPGKQWQRQTHAHRQQGDRIHLTGRIRQLDENRLEAETECRQHCKQAAVFDATLAKPT